MYDNITERQHTTNTCVGSHAGDTRTVFEVGKLDPQDGEGPRAEKHCMWIVPAPFCAIQYINDGKYLPGDSAPELQRAR